MKDRDDEEFTPHAIIVTERTVPSPIWAAAVIGVDRLLRLELDVSLPPSTFVRQAMNGLRDRLLEFSEESGGSTTSLPAFGRVVGFVINYFADRAVRHDLDGSVVEVLSGAYQVGEATLEFEEPDDSWETRQ